MDKKSDIVGTDTTVSIILPTTLKRRHCSYLVSTGIHFITRLIKSRDAWIAGESRRCLAGHTMIPRFGFLGVVMRSCLFSFRLSEVVQNKQTVVDWFLRGGPQPKPRLKNIHRAYKSPSIPSLIHRSPISMFYVIPFWSRKLVVSDRCRLAQKVKGPLRHFKVQTIGFRKNPISIGRLKPRTRS